MPNHKFYLILFANPFFYFVIKISFYKLMMDDYNINFGRYEFVRFFSENIYLFISLVRFICWSEVFS
jgi:hypothetical protein